MFTERRAFPRASIACRIAVLSDLRILAFNSDTENVSAGGVRVMLRERLPVATTIQLELSLSSDLIPIGCKGEVVWFKERNPNERNTHIFDTGIKFTDISELGREKIRNVVDSFLAERHVSQ